MAYKGGKKKGGKGGKGGSKRTEGSTYAQGQGRRIGNRSTYAPTHASRRP